VASKAARAPKDKATLQDIFPIIVGDRLDDGGMSDFWADGNSGNVALGVAFVQIILKSRFGASGGYG
jgi:hypothetical protein